jgi:hypothetical protein
MVMLGVWSVSVVSVMMALKQLLLHHHLPIVIIWVQLFQLLLQL